MYKINEYVIYDDGIGQIDHIEDNKVFLLTYPENQKIEIDLSQVVRKICSKEVIEEVIERIAYTCTLQIINEKFRKEVYQDAMKQFDELEWIKVIKSEYIRHKASKAKDFEKMYAKQAKHYLYCEISILLGIDYNDVEQYIVDKIHEEQWD